MVVEKKEDVDILVQDLIHQDFSFSYKLFVWLYTRFDLVKIYNELNTKITELFKNVQRYYQYLGSLY